MALQHLKIEVVEGAIPNYTFTAWINPSSYNYTYGIKAESESANQGGQACPIVQAYTPDSISFKLLLDATGLVTPPLPGQPLPKDGVASLINGFIANIAKPYPITTSEGSPKSQPKLNISWAQLQFACILTSLSIDYKLFKSDGTPIRAELSTSFSERPCKKAPDNLAVSTIPEIPEPQLITVIEGDTLPGLCDDIYGDAKLYMLVAKANGLSQFRTLIPGSVLAFPPLMGN